MSSGSNAPQLALRIEIIRPSQHCGTGINDPSFVKKTNPAARNCQSSRFSSVRLATDVWYSDKADPEWNTNGKKKVEQNHPEFHIEVINNEIKTFSIIPRFYS